MKWNEEQSGVEWSGEERMVRGGEEWSGVE